MINSIMALGYHFKKAIQLNYGFTFSFNSNVPHIHSTFV